MWVRDAYSFFKFKMCYYILLFFYPSKNAEKCPESFFGIGKVDKNNVHFSFCEREFLGKFFTRP